MESDRAQRDGHWVLLLPLAAFVLLGHADPAQWIPSPSWKRVEYLVYSLLGGDNTHGARAIAWPVYAIVLIAAAVAAGEAWRARGREQQGWHYALVASGALVPIAAVLAASVIKPIFVDKYLVECLPFAVLLLAVGVDRLRWHAVPHAASMGTMVLLLAISAHALARYYRTSDKDDWRSATHYILDSARAGDAAIFVPGYVVAPFDYYRASSDATTSSLVVIAPRNGAASASGAEHRYSRLWAVFNHDADSGAAVRDSLARCHPVVSDSQFTGVRVVLYDTR